MMQKKKSNKPKRAIFNNISIFNVNSYSFKVDPSTFSSKLPVESVKEDEPLTGDGTGVNDNSTESEKKNEKGHLAWYFVGCFISCAALLSFFFLSACLYDMKLPNPDDIRIIAIVARIFFVICSAVFLIFLVIRKHLKGKINRLWYLCLHYGCIVLFPSSIPLYLKVLKAYWESERAFTCDYLTEASKVYVCTIVFILFSVGWSFYIIKASSAKDINSAQCIVQTMLVLITGCSVFIEDLNKVISSDIHWTYTGVLIAYSLLALIMQSASIKKSKS